MTFEAREKSRFRGTPIECYEFQYGADRNAAFRYTNADETITWTDGRAFEPVPIDRDPIKASGTTDKQALTVRFPKNNPLADLFKVYPPSRVVNLTIWQGHEATDEFLVIWTGRVLGLTVKENEAETNCEPVKTSMQRSGLRRHYQPGCPHVLYGPLCRAVKRQWPAQARSVAGTVLQLEAGWNTSGFQAGRFAGGLAEWSGIDNPEPRTILRALDENTFALGGVLRDLEPGMEVRLALGCGRHMRDCEQLHSNIQNYGGCPWIPLESPFGKNPF